MADLLLTETADTLATEDGDLFALESDSGVGLAATVTIVANQNGHYDIGDVPVFTATFLDVDGAAVDPAVVLFTFRLFDGSETSYSFGSSSRVDTTDVGVYTFVAPELTQHARHVCRVDGSEPYAAGERAIAVRTTRFANP